MFATGDGELWMVINATRNGVDGTYSNDDRTILSSSSSLTSYSAKMYNRDGQSEDPWLSLSDHSQAVTAGEILYGGNSVGGTHASAVLPSHNGANVFIRSLAPGAPSLSPSLSPSLAPTVSTRPTTAPSVTTTPTTTPQPTTFPSYAPSVWPSAMPTPLPSYVPSEGPSVGPTQSPTQTPTRTPTPVPSQLPTYVPSSLPSPAPTPSPTATPSDVPTPLPTAWFARSVCNSTLEQRTARSCASGAPHHYSVLRDTNSNQRAEGEYVVANRSLGTLGDGDEFVCLSNGCYEVAADGCSLLEINGTLRLVDVDSIDFDESARRAFVSALVEAVPLVDACAPYCSILVFLFLCSIFVSFATKSLVAKQTKAGKVYHQKIEVRL